jgi:hypothetical protein
MPCRPDFDEASCNSDDKTSSVFRYLMLVYPTSSIYDAGSPQTNASLGLAVLVSSTESFRLQHLERSPTQDAGIPLKEYLDVLILPDLIHRMAFILVILLGMQLTG